MRFQEEQGLGLGAPPGGPSGRRLPAPLTAEVLGGPLKGPGLHIGGRAPRFRGPLPCFVRFGRMQLAATFGESACQPMLFLFSSRRCLFTLSRPLLRGPATRRLQQRRQRLLEQQREQQNPTPQPAAATAAPAAAAPDSPGDGGAPPPWLQQQQQQQQQQQMGPPKRVGSGFFANPMRAPEPVEGGNVAHSHFLEMHKQHVQSRIVERLIALRRYKQQQQQQQQQEGQEKAGGAVGTAEAEAADSLSSAFAAVYTQHEELLRQVTPRPHAFVEAHVKDLLAGASALANPLYPPSVPLGQQEEEDWEGGRLEGGAPKEGALGGGGPRSGAPSDSQLRRIAGLVHAPGLELLHAETDALLAGLDSSFEGPLHPPQDRQEGAPLGAHLLEGRAPAARGTEGAHRQTAAGGRPPPQMKPEEDLGLAPWEGAHSGGPLQAGEEEGAPSVVLLGGGPACMQGGPSSSSSSLHAAREQQSSTWAAADSRGLDEAEEPFDLGLERVGRRRGPPPVQQGAPPDSPRGPLGLGGPSGEAAAAACFAREARKAEAKAAAAREALLGPVEETAAGGSCTSSEGEAGGRRDSSWSVSPPSDPFFQSKEIRRHKEINELWKDGQAVFSQVRDAHIPVGFKVSGRTLAAYFAARRSCCLFDVSFRRVWEIEGRDRLAFADLIVSCDLQRQMKIGDAQPALLLDSKGLILDDCLVAKAEKSIQIWTSGHATSHVFEYLTEFANYCRNSGMRLSFHPSKKTAVLSLQGPLAMRRFAQQLQPLTEPSFKEEPLFKRHFISVSLRDAKGAPLTTQQMACLPFMSAWTVEIAALGFRVYWGFVVCSQETLYSVSCMRVGMTGEDGIEFAAEASGALILAKWVLGFPPAAAAASAAAAAASCPSVETVSAPLLGCFAAFEMLRVEAGLPLMGVDVRSSHTAPQAALARLVSLYKVRQQILLSAARLSKQLAMPPNVRRVAFIVGSEGRLRRAERMQRLLQQQQQGQQHQQQERQQEEVYFSDEAAAAGAAAAAPAEAAAAAARAALPSRFPLRGSFILSRCQRRPVGVVTSVVWSPLLRCRVGQGLVLFEFAKHREPVLFAVPEAAPPSVSKRRRGKLLRGRRMRSLVEGRLCRLPLVPHKYPVPESQAEASRFVRFSSLNRQQKKSLSS
ncbi:hypothetical protein Efla_007255 [Eimeria flavescens]